MNKAVKFSVFGLLILLCLIFLALFAGASVQPTSAHAVSADDNYSFTDISTDITVRKDKTYEITERLTVYFSVGGVNTGIIRDIQRISKTTRIVDGEERAGGRYIAELDLISVTLDGGECIVTQSLYDGGQFHSVKMQTPEGYFGQNSTHVFELKYIYDQSDDKMAGFDDFTLDVLGYAMATTQSFSAEITFPEGADLSNVTLRTNYMDYWEPNAEEGEEFTVDGNKITLKAKPRSANKGYTVQVLLPDGYFERNFKFNFYYLIFFGIAVAAVALTFVLAFGLKKKPLETVEFYPPEGMGVLRFAAIWRAGAKSKDAAALLLKWAGKGLVTVEQDGKRNVIITANVIKARKKAPSNRLTPEMLGILESPEERQYFDTLFGGIGGLNYTFSTRYFKKYATRTEKERLYDVTDKLIKGADKRPYSVKNDKKNTAVKWLLAFVSFIPALAAMGWYVFLWQEPVYVIFMVFILPSAFVMAVSVKEKQIAPIAVMFVWDAVLFGLFIWLAVMPAYDYFGMIFYTPVFWIVSTFALLNRVAYHNKETDGDYGKLLGFKRFLLTAELPRIQLLFDKNPEYFTDILPYCLIMGISEKVKKRFAALEIKVPQYVENNVDLRSFSSDMGRASSHVAPSSRGWSSGNSGGGSSGGGGSGGSSGGGGGGGGSRGC